MWAAAQERRWAAAVGGWWVDLGEGNLRAAYHSIFRTEPE